MSYKRIRTVYTFYLKGDVNDFLRKHPEFVHVIKWSDGTPSKNNFAYNESHRRNSLHLIRPRKGTRFRFHCPSWSTPYVAKMMELNEEGWVEPKTEWDEEDYIGNERRKRNEHTHQH